MWDREPDASLLHKPADLHIELCGNRSFRKINPVHFGLCEDRKSRYVYNGKLQKTCYSLRGLGFKFKLGGLTHLGQWGWERRQLIWCKTSLLTNATVCIFGEWDHRMLYTSHKSLLFKWCSRKKVHANLQSILMDLFNLIIFWFEMKISIFFHS